MTAVQDRTTITSQELLDQLVEEGHDWTAVQEVIERMVDRGEFEHDPGELMEHLLLTPAEVLAVRARVETSATEDGPRRPFFAPHPVEDYPTARRPRTALEDGSGTSDHYGYCADFCAHDSAPTKGANVDDHGHWCTSTIGAVVEGRDHAGGRVTIAADLARMYLHGVYRDDDLHRVRWGRETLIRVFVESGRGGQAPDLKFYVEPGRIRSLAAALVHLADCAEGLDQSLADRIRRERLEDSAEDSE